MKAITFLVLGSIALLASLAVACGDGNDSPSTSGAGAGALPGGGMIAPDQFMTYDDERYELVNLLFEDMVPAEEFQPIGVATEADVDLKGDMRVFTREGDTTAVYTYSAPTADDSGFWLAWRLVA